MSRFMSGADSDLTSLANPSLGQHFLVSPHKLSLLTCAAGIRPTDYVVELGAGAGTIARTLPQCASLTVVELDHRLIRYLERNVPTARIIQGDALEIIRDLRCDVLIGSLPNVITEALLEILPSTPFRTAVLAVGKLSNLARLEPEFRWQEVVEITGGDFIPPQVEVSRLVRVVRASNEVTSSAS